MDYAASEHLTRLIHPFFLSVPVAQSLRKRNALLPVSRLPSELVIKIMRIVASEPPPFAARWWTWTVLTHVYHYWRSIAFNCPALWINISLWPYTEERIRAWIRRSREMPLMVTDSSPVWRGDEAEHEKAVSFVLKEHWDRLQELDVSLSEEESSQLQWPKRPSTTLRSLKIQRYLGRTSRPALPVAVLSFLSDSNLNHLELSGLRNLHFIWFGNRFPETLTHLHLNCAVPTSSEGPYSLQHILEVLEGLPLLKSLELSNMIACPRNSISPVIFRPKNLHKISIYNGVMSLMNFLRHVELPLSSSIQKRVYCLLQPGLTDWDDIVHTLSTFLNGPKRSESHSFIRPVVMSCVILFENFWPARNGEEPGLHAMFAISCSTERISGEELIGYGLGDGELYVGFQAHYSDEMEVWRQESILSVCQALPVYSAETLVLYNYPSDGDSRMAWFQYLCREFRRVQILRLEGVTPGDHPDRIPVFHLLAYTDIADESDQRNIIFPQLRDLSIASINFKASLRSPKSYCRRLGKALKKRRDMGKGVSNLHVLLCEGIRACHTECLRRHVDKLVVYP